MASSHSKMFSYQRKNTNTWKQKPYFYLGGGRGGGGGGVNITCCLHQTLAQPVKVKITMLQLWQHKSYVGKASTMPHHFAHNSTGVHQQPVLVYFSCSPSTAASVPRHASDSVPMGSVAEMTYSQIYCPHKAVLTSALGWVTTLVAAAISVTWCLALERITLPFGQQFKPRLCLFTHSFPQTGLTKIQIFMSSKGECQIQKTHLASAIYENWIWLYP